MTHRASDWLQDYTNKVAAAFDANTVKEIVLAQAQALAKLRIEQEAPTCAQTLLGTSTR